MFADMRERAPFDVDSDLLWGYFFTGRREDELGTLARELESRDYRFVRIRPDEQRDGYWLHMEKVEAHSPETLDTRNQELSQLAATFRANYDGMDVGPVLDR